MLQRFLATLALSLSLTAGAFAQQGPSGYVLGGHSNGNSPTNSTGSEGQWYEDFDTGNVYNKTSDAWLNAGSLPQITSLSQSPTKHLGVVSEGNFFMDGKFGAVQTAMARWPMFMRAPSSSKLAFVIPNVYMNTGSMTETGGGAPLVCTGSLEYPAGTFQQMTTGNGASTSMTVASGAIGVSDNFANPPPVGAEFYTRLFCTTTGAGVIPAKVITGTPSGFGIVGSGPDLTMSGTVVNGTPYTGNVSQVNTWAIAPIVIGTTTARSFGEFGDSRVQNYADDYYGNVIIGGLFERSVGAYAPTLNLGTGGDHQQYFNASHATRLALALSYTTDYLNGYGINDLAGSGETAAQLEAQFLTFLTYFPSTAKVSLATIPPYTSQTPAAITTLTYSGLIETVTLTAVATNNTPAATVFPGETIAIAGATPSAENGNCVVQAITGATTFTCSNPTSTGTGTATGTITALTGWQDTVYQTQVIANDLNRSWGVNEWCRTSATALGFYRCLDITSVFESGYNSGMWDVYSSAGQKVSLSYDGIHPSVVGHSKLSKSGIMSAAALN